MKKIELGQTIGILANVGVIAGIIVLIVEITQNEESLYEDRLETSLVLFNDFREFVSQSEEMTDIWMKGIAEQQMTATSNQRFEFMCQSYQIHAPARRGVGPAPPGWRPRSAVNGSVSIRHTDSAADIRCLIRIYPHLMLSALPFSQPYRPVS